MMTMTRTRRVLPGFGITMGFTLLYLSLIVLIPLSTVLLKTATLSWSEFWGTVTSARTLAAYRLSLETAWIAASVNVIAASWWHGCWCGTGFLGSVSSMAW